MASSKDAKKDKAKRSAFALPSTASAAPSTSTDESSKPDPVQGLQHSFQNCVEQLKVGSFENRQFHVLCHHL